MLALWNTEESSMLGLDIGSSSVRVLEIGKKADSYRLLAYARESIPEGAVKGKNIKDPDIIIEKISSAIKKLE